MSGKLQFRDGIPEVICSLVDMEGKSHTIRRGSRQHDTLAPEQLQRIARLQYILKEVYSMTLDGWVDGFLRDMHPENEISIIEAAAVVYQKLTSNTRLPLQEKENLYALIISMSTGVPPKYLKKNVPEGLPSAMKIYKMYCKARKGFARP